MRRDEVYLPTPIPTSCQQSLARERVRRRRAQSTSIQGCLDVLKEAFDTGQTLGEIVYTRVEPVVHILDPILNSVNPLIERIFDIPDPHLKGFLYLLKLRRHRVDP